MNIYAIRDRLIDYYMQPFVAPGDNEVQAALAATINTTGDTNAISQAPHHFQLWKLGQIGDDGQISAQKELICDCSSLIRRSIRKDGEPGSPQAPQTGHQGINGANRAEQPG